MKLKNSALILGVVLLLLALGLPRAFAFNHPCIPVTLEELNTIKASLNQQPWKQGYAVLSGAGTSQLTYTMRGPFVEVKRNPNLNLNEWRTDMVAVYNLARMWYFTGNAAYAQKSHDILIAWATTQTSFGGQESGLDLGDYAVCYGGGASILRGTWPGWTPADTTAVKNYFLNVLWPATAASVNVAGPANKGSLNLAAGIALATFCDDTEKFNHIIEVFRTYPGTGLRNSLPTGQMGETGRDAGHSYGDLKSQVFIAEVAWKQGIDLYSEAENRLLACGEYYARNTFATDNPFVPFGTVDYNYYENAEGRYNANRAAFYMLQNAYKNRRGLPTPWIDWKMSEQNVDDNNWMYAKTADFTTAASPTPVSFPEVSPASGGLTLTTLGTQTAGRDASYANGVWTVTGLGNTVWTDTTDDCQFAYATVNGDCAIVARVLSSQYHAGVMIRDDLSATVSKRAWIGILSGSPSKVEARSTGWTVNWGGSNWARRTQDLPPGLPYWLKVERRGNIITTYTSQDGANWAATISSDYATMPATVHIGLYVCSGSATPNTATFDHVSFTGGTGGLVTTPAAPAALFATASSKSITVRWLPSFDAASYELLRSTTSGGGYTVIASDFTYSQTSYVDTAVTSGTTYYYIVRAKNAVGTSGNSPEFGASPTGAKLVSLAFSGTSSASFKSGAGVENSDEAFNGDPGSKWYGWDAPTGWLQYDFGEGNAQIIKRYTINSADVATRDPKNWNFLGSQDGVNWTTLDTQSDQSFFLRLQQNTYNVANTTAYRFYRLDVTANNGATGLAIGDLGLWGDSGRTIPDGRYRIVNRNSHKIVDVAGGSSSSGATLVQSSWSGADSQQWDIAWQGNGQYSATRVASTQAIDNSGSSNAGSNLVIQNSNGSTSQRWTIVPESDGFLRITSANSGLVMDVSGGSTAAGANIVQETYAGGARQQWMPSIGSALQSIPPTPTGLTATPVSISQINLSWTASPGAISYRIKRATSSGGPFTPLAAEPNTTTWSDTGLSTGTTYYYVVSALNGSGESADSAPANATTLAAPPAAPTGVSATSGSNRVTLSWAASGGATSYTVKRATTSGGPYTTVADNVTSTGYTDTTVANDITYYYVVSASNANGPGANSAEVAISAGTLGVHLKFDETDGAIAYDSSGRGQHATLVGGPGFAAGFLDNALDLPGVTGQYAKLPSGIVSGLTDFTLATWIKVNAFATWQRIFDFGSGTNNYMFLSAQGAAGAGKPRFAIRTASVGEQKIDSSIALTAGTWAHIAVIRSGSTVRIYINGALAGSGTITLSPADLGITTQNYLGKSQFSDPYLNARLDDLRLYAFAMTPEELNALVHPAAGAPTRLAALPGNTRATISWVPNGTTTYAVKRSTTSGGPYSTIADNVTALTYVDTGLTNGTRYYYVVSGANADGSGPDSAEISVVPSPLSIHLKFDESSGAIAADSSSGQDAKLINGPTFGAGILGNALELPATSAQYAKLPSGILNGLTDFTISTWIKVNAFATWQRIFDFGSGTTNYMFLVAQGPAGAARPRFAIRTSTVTEQKIDSSIALTPGSWTHIAVTRSGTTVQLYINGYLAGSGTITLNPADLGVTTQNYLGKSQFNDPYLNASLDDFRLYGQAMTASDVALHASPLAAPQNLVATPGPLSVDLTWNAVPNATRYTMKYATTSGGPYTTLAADLSSTSTQHSGLNAGTTYYYVVSAGNSLYDSPASAEVSATVAKAPASVTLGTLAFTYDGTPKSTTATTTPAGLSVGLTYAGSTTAPTNAGSYTVVANVTDPNYVGSATSTLTIEKANASVALGTLTFTYDGSPKAATATTAPAGLPVSFTYDGSSAAPTNAGSYAVSATVTDANYTGNATGTLTIAKAAASIVLAPLTQLYDGTSKTVTATTSPAGLTVTLSYDGVSNAPIYPGPHTVVATIDDPNYVGTESDTLTIGITALVRHAPVINGVVSGSLQVILPESITFNGTVSGDLLVPGLPSVGVNASATYAGTLDANGSPMPSSQVVTLGSSAVLRHVVRRVDAIVLPIIAAPSAPTGTRDVSLSSAGSVGDFATLRNLSLSGTAGSVAVPAGTYGSLSASGSTTLVLGVADATEPAVYNVQGLTLSGGASLQVVGPVVINLAKGPSLSGKAGAGSRPDWLVLRVASEDVTVTTDAAFSGNVVLNGYIIAPTASVIISGNAELRGGIIADRLTINGSGLLDENTP